jgi:hypothetical protein
VGQGLLDQHVHGLVVNHVALVVDQAVLAVRGEGIQRDVGDDPEGGEALLQRRHGPLGQAFRIPRLARVIGLAVRRHHRKQRDGRDAQFEAAFGGRQQAVDRHALDTRHGGHVFGGVVALEHEYRPDQVAGGQEGLAHQAAGELVGAHAPHADCGKAHVVVPSVTTLRLRCC